jgi:hypothetical protein
MNFIISRGFALLVVLLLSACSFKPIDPTIIEQPEEVDRIVDETFEALLARDAGQMQEMLHSKIAKDVTLEQLEAVLDFVPETVLVDKIHIGRNFNSIIGTESYTKYTNTYQLEFDGNVFIQVSVVALKQDGEMGLAGLHVKVLEKRLEETYKFSLQGKPVSHYAILAAMIFSVLLVLVTIVHIMMNWKKLQSPIRWLVFSLFGISALSLNWTTGEISFQLLHIGLLSGGFSSSNPSYAPWIFTWYPPIIAALYWFRAKKKDTVTPTER